MATIGNAIEKYEAQEVQIVDYENAVRLLIDNDIEETLSNDSYSNALVLTNLMMEKANREVRILTSGFFEIFIKPLRKTLLDLISRLKNSEKSFVRIILVHSNPNYKFTIAEKEILDKFEIKHATYNGPPNKLQHFICIDENTCRVEKPHPELDIIKDEAVIKADIYFNNKIVTQSYNDLFDNIWGKLK